MKPVTMPNSCRAPGCNVGYKPRKKKQKKNDAELDEEIADTEKYALFKFPTHEDDPERRARWIAQVPGDNWKPKDAAEIFLCEKHVMPSDIIEESMDITLDAEKNENPTNCFEKS